ncbi:MAG TPA: M28 family peptidase, partial [Longimicrobiaceae bacterium]|nr:M28 family peptidase [Longimicrobiaceae bacterium]
GLVVLPSTASAQTFRSADSVIRRMWQIGMEQSQTESLAQVLIDSIGPRLSGTAGFTSAVDWLERTYKGWGVTVRRERYGTWRGWRRGHTHVDLMEPRVRSLEGTMLAWSPGTNGPVTAGVVILPDLADSTAFRAWLPSASGKFVLISFPQPTCRPDDNWVRFAAPGSYERMRQARQAAAAAWTQRIQRTGFAARDLPKALEQAGAVGVLTHLWSQGWGVDKVFQARTERVPSLDLSCEDYGLVYRLAQHGQGPVVRLDAQAELGPEVPAMNTVAEVRGRQLPDEYVLLSAHFDSWDASSGATDNGTGTVVMMEAMRILRQVYPRPRRTIIAGHWSGEEQGLNGSRGYAADHPQVVQNLQALFNQDNGTGRIVNFSHQGFTNLGPVLGRWWAQLPPELVDSIRVDSPGLPSGGGSDNASFVCAGVPAFGLGSLSWDYGTYTWHTNRDTYDKIVFDDVRRNATLVAMLVYLAAEEPQRLPRERRTEFPVNQQTGQPGAWPACQQPTRSAAASTR